MAAVIAAVLLWTGGWHWMAAIAEDRIRTAMANGQTACTDLEVTGFPFRIGLSCSKASYIAPNGSARIEGLLLRTAAQLYRPGHVIAEVASPVGFAAEGVEGSLAFSSMMASSIGLPVPERMSVVAKTPKLSLSMDGVTLPWPEARESQVHLRRSMDEAGTETGIDAALSMTGLMPGADESDVALDLGWTAPEALQALFARAEPNAAMLRATSGVLRDASVRFAGGGSMAASGPLSLSAEGLLSGEVTLVINRHPELPARLGRLASAFGLDASNVAAILSQTGGEGETRVTVTLREGRAFIGFIPLGRIPPV
jgi:hypothetical protein